MLSLLLSALLIADEPILKNVGVFYRVNETTLAYPKDSFRLIKDLGITWVIPMFDEPDISEGLQKLTAVLPSDGPRVVLYPSVSWLASMKDRSPQAVEDALANAFAQNPNTPWAEIDGKRVVLLPRADVFPNQEGLPDGLRTRARKSTGDDLFIVGDPSWGNEVDGRCRFGGSQLGPKVVDDALRIVTLGPGYDDTGWRDTGSGVRMRENGAYYRWCWHEAKKQQAEIVLIESWNDLNTQTHIGPDRPHGFQYTEITREEIARFSEPLDEEPTLAWPLPLPRDTRVRGWELREQKQVRFATESPFTKGVYPQNGALHTSEVATRLTTSANAWDVADSFYTHTRGPLKITVTFESLDDEVDMELQVDGTEPNPFIAGSGKTQSFTVTDPQLLGRLPSNADIRIDGLFSHIAEILIERQIPEGIGFTWELPATDANWKHFETVCDNLHWSTARVLVSWKDLRAGRIALSDIVDAARKFYSKSLFVIVALHDRPEGARAVELFTLGKTIAQQCKETIFGFEVLSHPNTASGFATATYVDRYIALIREFARSVHEVDPALWISSGNVWSRDQSFTQLLQGGDRSLSLDALNLSPFLIPNSQGNTGLDAYFQSLDLDESLQHVLPTWLTHPGFPMENDADSSERYRFLGHLARLAFTYESDVQELPQVVLDSDTTIPSIGGISPEVWQRSLSEAGFKIHHHRDLSQPLNPNEHPIFVWTHGSVLCPGKTDWLIDYVRDGGLLICAGSLPGLYAYDAKQKTLALDYGQQNQWTDHFWIGFRDSLRHDKVPQTASELSIPTFLKDRLAPPPQIPVGQYLVRRKGRPRDGAAEHAYVPLLHVAHDGQSLGEAAALYRYTKRGQGRLLLITWDSWETASEQTQADGLVESLEAKRRFGADLIFLGPMFGDRGLYRDDGSARPAVEALKNALGG